MADILIRGMEMPHNCFRCVLSHLRGERLFCYITKDEVLRSKIAPDCPLHELPEHGDLIDRDYIQRTLKPYSKEDEQVEVTLGTAKRLIQNAINAPVVIPSNKEAAE